MLRISTAFALSLASLAAFAQTPPAQAPLAVANPTYVSIPMEVTVNKPAADVWKRIGKYCDISEWLQIPAGCQILSGKDNEVGVAK